MRGWLALLPVVCACSAQLGNGGGIDATPSGDDTTADASDGSTGLGPWSTPLKIPGASTNQDEDDGTLSSDTLELFYSYADPADNARKHIYTVTRANAQTMVWTPPARLSFNVNGTTDQTPRLSDDGLKMYFASNRPGTTGGLDIWVVSRGAIGGPWGMPALVPGINSPQTEKTCVPCDGGRYLVISGRGGAGDDVYEGVLDGAAPARVAELSSTDTETGTFISKDCLTMYFASDRSGTNQIYRSSRAAIGPWAMPTLVVDFTATGGAQEDPWLAGDLRTFVFATEIANNKDIYLTTR